MVNNEYNDKFYRRFEDQDIGNISILIALAEVGWMKKSLRISKQSMKAGASAGARKEISINSNVWLADALSEFTWVKEKLGRN